MPSRMAYCGNSSRLDLIKSFRIHPTLYRRHSLMDVTGAAVVNFTNETQYNGLGGDDQPTAPYIAQT